MYFYVYKITNLINDNIYIGVHKTNNLEDGYLGSGKILSHAIEKHGKENFKKEIISFFASYEEALEHEKSIVNEEFVSRKDTYNIRLGGLGGFDYINSSKEVAEKRSKSMLGEKNHFYGKHHKEETIKIISQKASEQWKGVPKTEEQKQKIAAANTGKKFSEERKRNISLSTKGRIPHNKGKKADMFLCEHCNKEVAGASNFKRWHNDNCKEKK
jgi:hypothetical protein